MSRERPETKITGTFRKYIRNVYKKFFVYRTKFYMQDYKRLVTLTHPLMTQIPAAPLRLLCILLTICYNILLFLCGGNIDR